MSELRPEMLDPSLLLYHIKHYTKFDAALVERIIKEWKAYKATGLTPEELVSLKDNKVIPEHWRELFIAEGEGRLIVLPTSDRTEKAVAMVVDERRRQIAEWGDQSGIDLFEFMSILGEEFGELCEAVNETLFVNPKHPERGGIDAIRREAVQVAAVAAQIIEACMDGRREDGDGDG